MKKNDMPAGLETGKPFLGHCNHALRYSPTHRMNNHEEENVHTLTRQLPVLNQLVSDTSNSRVKAGDAGQCIYISPLPVVPCGPGGTGAAAPDAVSTLSQ